MGFNSAFKGLIQTVIYTGFSNNWILLGYIKISGPQIILTSGIPSPTTKNTDQSDN